MPLGRDTGYHLDWVYLREGHVAGAQEPGAYVIGFDIIAARSDGHMWAIYFGDMSERWYQYKPLLPAETAAAVYRRGEEVCRPLVED